MLEIGLVGVVSEIFEQRHVASALHTIHQNRIVNGFRIAPVNKLQITTVGSDSESEQRIL